MQQSDIKSNLEQSGFVFTDLDNGGRVTARGPRVPGGEVGRKTIVRVEKGGETVHGSQHHSNAAAASEYVELVDEYS